MRCSNVGEGAAELAASSRPCHVMTKHVLVGCCRFMIRRTSSVLQALLPAKVEQVVFCKMSPLQQRLYSHFLNSPAVRSTLEGACANLA